MMIKSRILDEKEISELVELMGTRLAKVYIVWSDAYIEEHIEKWMLDNGYDNHEDINEVDRKRLENHIVERFAEWLEYFED